MENLWEDVSQNGDLALYESLADESVAQCGSVSESPESPPEADRGAQTSHSTGATADISDSQALLVPSLFVGARGNHESDMEISSTDSLDESKPKTQATSQGKNSDVNLYDGVRDTQANGLSQGNANQKPNADENENVKNGNDKTILRQNIDTSRPANATERQISRECQDTSKDSKGKKPVKGGPKAKNTSEQNSKTENTKQEESKDCKKQSESSRAKQEPEAGVTVSSGAPSRAVPADEKQPQLLSSALPGGKLESLPGNDPLASKGPANTSSCDIPPESASDDKATNEPASSLTEEGKSVNNTSEGGKRKIETDAGEHHSKGPTKRHKRGKYEHGNTGPGSSSSKQRVYKFHEALNGYTEPQRSYTEAFLKIIIHYNLGLSYPNRKPMTRDDTIRYMMSVKKYIPIRVVTDQAYPLNFEEVVTLFTVCPYELRLKIQESNFIREKLCITKDMWETYRSRLMFNKQLYTEKSEVMNRLCGIHKQKYYGATLSMF